MKSVIPVALIALLATSPSGAQEFKAELKTPSASALAAARKMCTELFENLKAGKTQEIADWLQAQIGYLDSEANKITNRNKYKSQLDVVLAGPPASPYGKVDGYDLIDEAYLPGTNRYFRFVYMSYHQKAPLIWEFRFYVGPSSQVSLNSFAFSDKNPFEYMSTSDMRLPSWVHE